jgi:bifunctional enzyme CysN/CysC
VSALEGDNVFAKSTRMPWYRGPTLMDHLDTVKVSDTNQMVSDTNLRLPVQYVNRPSADFRGYSGRIAAGSVRVGDRVRVLPSGVQSSVTAIFAGLHSPTTATSGDSVTLTLADQVDVARGDVIAASDDAPQVADQFEARILWMSEHALVAGRTYLLKLHACETSASVTAIKYREDVETGAHLAAKTLALNEIGVVNLSASRALVFEPYAANRTMGGFILIDKLTFDTVGAGMIDFALRRASNIHWQALDIDKATRGAAMRQQPRCIWFTGLSGSGKSTIANLLEKRLHADGRHTYLLDGDNVRHGLNRDLGFTEADRVENIRRVAEVAKLMVDAGLIVLVSFISPFRAERRMARELFAPGEFIEVFVDTRLEVCEKRDPKGLYAKARRGELKNFTGIDSAYEAPESPEVRVTTETAPPEECVKRILEQLE